MARMTATSKRLTERASAYVVHEWVTGGCWVMVYLHGTPCQIQSGEGPMIYETTGAAVRAVTRINPQCELLRIEKHQDKP